MTYEYDVDGILHVLVRDVRSGATLADEQLQFGTGGGAGIAAMRRRVDQLMNGHGPNADGAA